MFPPNLQKNIQELERQISLLETECEHMEAESEETPPSAKQKHTSAIRDFLNQPFVTGPSVSLGSYSCKTSPSATPKIYSASCAHFRTTNEKFSTRVNLPKSPQLSRRNRTVGFNDPNPEKSEGGTVCGEPKCPPLLDVHKTTANVLEKNESPAEPNYNRENKKDCKCSISSIREVSEASEENYPTHVLREKKKPRSNSRETSEEQTWCELLREPSSPGRKTKNKKKAEPPMIGQLSEAKLSSDEECKKGIAGEKGKFQNGNWLTEAQPSSEKRISSRRRPRSALTKKKCTDEIPMDITKALLEKEIQCAMGNEEKEKEEFFTGLNESIKTLHLLIDELKTKMSREKRNGVLKDMQNTLMKISDIKSMNLDHKPAVSISSLKETNKKLLKNEENMMDVKNTLFALKQFCQKMSAEKSALTEEITVKNRALASFKSKEKEYLSLISSLKYNLEKIKEEAEEGAHAKRDLKLVKHKLQEETKVIEALKKSHEKMQELIENYVLENDKLRAQMKIAQLEAQKFNVLMAGKEAEIKKYKKELESFQKQITEQLSLLRSKATENEIEQTITSITKRRNIVQTESNSLKSQVDTTFEGDDLNENLDEKTVPSTTTITHSKTETKHASSVNAPRKNEWETQSNSSHEVSTPQGRNAVFTSNESEVESHPNKRQYGLERVLSSSKNLRSSINELLEDIRRESSEMYWLSPSNSCASSSPSVLISTSTEDVSEGERHN